MNSDLSHFSFEKAYETLETILTELNSGQIALEKSLELYEKANGLIALCSSKLNQAEQKIEMLIKNRAEGVETVPYSPTFEKVFDQINDTNP